MLKKEKTKLDGQNCYLLGESNYGYGLVYLLETNAEYELIYKDEKGYVNEINTFGGYRLYEPREIYDMLGDFVIADKEIDIFNHKMYEYHVAVGARNISWLGSRFEDLKNYEYYESILDQIRLEIAKMLSPEGGKND